MGFTQAVRTVLRRYADLSGRSRRSEYWWFAVFNVGVSIVLQAVDHVVGSEVLGDVVAVALLVPGVCVAVRRLHDTGHAGGWWLLNLLPIVGWIILIVWYARDSDQGDNRFGYFPKHELHETSGSQPSAPGSW